MCDSTSKTSPHCLETHWVVLTNIHPQANRTWRPLWRRSDTWRATISLVRSRGLIRWADLERFFLITFLQVVKEEVVESCIIDDGDMEIQMTLARCLLPPPCPISLPAQPRLAAPQLHLQPGLRVSLWPVVPPVHPHLSVPPPLRLSPHGASG